jgi:hypothetical protein
MWSRIGQSREVKQKKKKKKKFINRKHKEGR